jgi:hypothetical protein
MEKDSSPKLEGLRPEQIVSYAALFLAVNLLLCVLIGFLKPHPHAMLKWENLQEFLKMRSDENRQP